MAKSKNPDDGVSTCYFYFDVVSYAPLRVVGGDGDGNGNGVRPGNLRAHTEYGYQTDSGSECRRIKCVEIKRGRKRKVNENKHIILVSLLFFYLDFIFFIFTLYSSLSFVSIV